jgi:hypothetical protein
MKKLNLTVFALAAIFALVAVFGMSCKKSDEPKTEEELFNNNNVFAVTQDPNGPPQATSFVLNGNYEITFIETYHYFNGGTPAGEIMLTDQSGTQYGPWQATGRDGQGGVVDAYWSVEPSVSLPSGTYTIGVSNITTWSYNAESNNQGFAIVKGIKQ